MFLCCKIPVVLTRSFSNLLSKVIVWLKWENVGS